MTGGVRGVAGRTGAILARIALATAIVVAIAVLFGALVLPMALATDQVMSAVRSDVLDVPPLGEADTPPQNSYVYAADGSELAELTFEENRVPVTLDAIPEDAVNAVLATEDADFWEHEGVNHAAIIRAALTNFSAGGIESGASTITQQYVKLTFLSPEQTLARKIEEAIYAIRLERDLPKEEILERYLNRSYFGSGVYGIGTAAERYFSKDIGDLTLGEAATLAGLLRAPEANNPIASPQNAETRRDIVLRQMATHGFVSSAQAQAAIDTPLEVSISEPPAPENPFWSNWVSRLLINQNLAEDLGTQVNALEIMGETSDERRRTVFQSGLRIHTTLDPQLQGYAEQALRDHLLSEDAERTEVAQAPMGAIVSVEPGTGAIRTMALGPYEFGACADDGSWVGQLDDGRLLCDRTNVNPAVPGGAGSGRQPGSSFKPMIEAAALEFGISPGLVLDARGPRDIEGCITDDGEPYTVRNTGGDGVLNMYQAVAQSSNVYHALLIAEIGPDRAAEMAERLSGYPIPSRDHGCALALGATDVTPLAMANAYATLANRGEYCDAFPISRIEDNTGRTIWEHQPNCRQVIDTEIADRIVDMLEGPVSPGGTAPGSNLGEWPTRGKTGSTNDHRDAWFVGFVKQLSTAAWIGYPGFERVYETQEQATAACGATERPACQAPRELLRNVRIAGQDYAQVYGGTIPAPMWATYMREAVQNLTPEGFEDPGPIPSARVPNLMAANSLSEAEQLARDAGYRLSVRRVDHYRSADTFLRQSPSSGSTAPLGTTITLEVSNGEIRLPRIPDVLGMTLDEAADALFSLGFDVAQREETTEDEDLIGRVLDVDPEVGAEANPDTTRVVLNIGVPPPEDDDDDSEDDGDNGDGEDNNDDGDNDNADNDGDDDRGNSGGNRDDRGNSGGNRDNRGNSADNRDSGDSDE